MHVSHPFGGFDNHISCHSFCQRICQVLISPYMIPSNYMSSEELSNGVVLTTDLLSLSIIITILNIFFIGVDQDGWYQNFHK